MFEIFPQTREEAIEAMRRVLLGADSSAGPDVPREEFLSDEHLGAAFDAAVSAVRKQFGF